MNNTPSNGAPVATVPFTTIPQKVKRRVDINSGFSPDLRLPTQKEIMASKASAPQMGQQPPQQFVPPPQPQAAPQQHTIQANPPIVPRNAQLLTSGDPTESMRLPTVITNNSDMAVFDEELFERFQAPSANVEMRINENDRIDLGPFSERLALPSNGVFYDFNSIVIRPFKAPELALLYKAKKNRDIVLLNDTVSKTVNVDIRELWTIDARWVMYWHRWNSFPKTPYLASWESIYGNANKTKILMSDVNITPIKMTRDEYATWHNKGFKVPTVRDTEHLDTFRDKLSEEDLWLYERALFLRGNNLHQQKKILDTDENSVDILYKIKEFSQLIAEGQIIETAKSKDQHFNYDAAIKRLGADLEMINSILGDELGLNPEQEHLLYERRSKVIVELSRLVEFKDQPGEAEPVLETIVLKLGVLDFFPDIF